MDLRSAWKALVDASNDDFLQLTVPERAQMAEMKNRLQFLTPWLASQTSTKSVSDRAHASTVDCSASPPPSSPSPCLSMDEASNVLAVNCSNTPPPSSPCPLPAVTYPPSSLYPSTNQAAVTSPPSSLYPSTNQAAVTSPPSSLYPSTNQAAVTSPPSPPYPLDEAVNVPAVSPTSSPCPSTHEVSKVPAVECDNISTDEASNVPAVTESTYEKLLHTLSSSYEEIRVFTCGEVQDAIGYIIPQQQDYRLLDILLGTNSMKHSPQAKFRVILAERSLALTFERWELSKGHQSSRVQDLTNDLAKAQRRNAKVRLFCLRTLPNCDATISSKHIYLGIKYLVMERLLKKELNNCKDADSDSIEGITASDGIEGITASDGIEGITVFVAFAYRQWHKVKYNDFPTLIQRIQDSPELLALIKAITPWMKQAQSYYDRIGRDNCGTKRKWQEGTSGSLAPYTRSSHYSPTKSRCKLIRSSSKPPNASSESYSQSFTFQSDRANVPTQVQTERSSFSYSYPTGANAWGSLYLGAGNTDDPQQLQTQEALDHHEPPLTDFFDAALVNYSIPDNISDLTNVYDADI